MEVPNVYFNSKLVSKEVNFSIFTANRISEALELLANRYIVDGNLIHGNGAGREVGMPTANIEIPQNKIYPPFGVYASVIHVARKNYLAATNVGLRPSHDDDRKPTMECFILDFDQDIYGEKILVELKKFIRPVIKFKNLQEVKTQVDKDVTMIRWPYIGKGKQRRKA
ncbi:MAG: hypothetical protein HUJ51_02925 [Eggerthellaceae bacterium]|nr:hypothetical protein [Eggerthellaceae bacterium]